MHPAHRNKGIGRWLKATNAQRVVNERPEVREIETWNGEVNEAMLTINRSLGFQTVTSWREWQLQLD